MSALICGSMAFDKIANYESSFADAILPDQIHILNVSFFTPQLRQEFGGCAGNIAYSHHALGATPVILATMGADHVQYFERLDELGISSDHIYTLKDQLTAQCFIITDKNNNQINAFHPGAMNEAHQYKIPTDKNIKIGIIAPDGRQAMVDHAQQMYDAKIPFIFDPGQGLPMFNGDELKAFMSMATWVAVNDYEAKLLCDRTRLTLEAISKTIPGALFVTYGAKGSEVWQQGNATSIEPTKPKAVIDPTGCGDAYRSGLLYGLENGWTAVDSARLGSELGAIKIASQGPQNHTITADILSKYK